MSVQAGIWNFDGPAVDLNLLNDFSESLRQQGPDGESSYVQGNIAMLYRPFYTMAESRREKQPYVTRRGFILTWDGRLDNRDEVIAELRSDLEADSTDVAIVAGAFDQWENDCFRRLVGDWAISIWKPEQRELLMAVDYLAIRHIFLYLKNNRIWWSTDLSPLLLLSNDKFHLDDNYIAGYFANDPDSYLTPYREIHQVPAGQFLRVRGNGGVSVGRHWEFSSQSRIHHKTDAEYEEHFSHVFRHSVRRRLRSDSPILAELSGGLDSSSIVCMADDILSKEKAQTPRLDTLSFYDNTEPNGDDWTYFLKIEERRGREGTHIDISEYGRSAPFEYTNFAPLPGYLGAGRRIEAHRADVIRRGGYKVVLSGLGGDELLGGIPDPRAQLADLIVQCKFVSLAKQLAAWSLVKRIPWIQLLWQSSIELLPAMLRRYAAKEANVEVWLEKDFVRRTRFVSRLLGPSNTFGLWLPTRRSNLGLVLLMANKLAKWMPPSLMLEEGRYPYLDQGLVEFILSIPATQLLRPGERRSLTRRALAGVVPEDILSRPTKQFGARTPALALAHNLTELELAFQIPFSSTCAFINRDCFVESLRSARHGQDIHTVRMLKTISLEFWLRDLAARRLIDAELFYAPAIGRESARVAA
jgi:asparagine synthase (glutamine-hydrolysing)